MQEIILFGGVFWVMGVLTGSFIGAALVHRRMVKRLTVLRRVMR